MLLLFTDFGAEGPYLGQMEAVVRVAAPEIPVINLLSNAPAGEPELASYLLAALAPRFPANSVFVCVVDPGVGGARQPVALQADGRWFVGPDNGLLEGVAQAAGQAAWHIIQWRPQQLSSSFHGRDLFAPVAARIAKGDFGWEHVSWDGPDLSARSPDYPGVIYCDHYGNAITGWRYTASCAGRTLIVNGRRLPQASTFCDVGEGQAFWYENSMGLVEIAVNRGRADVMLNLKPGAGFDFEG
jgi:S-adenosylmethionine hydrolase